MKLYQPIIYLAIACLGFNQAYAQTLQGSRPNIDQFYKQSTRLSDFHVSPTCASCTLYRSGKV
jgi:hypothetical protein